MQKLSSAGSIFVDLLLRDSQYTSGWKKARDTTKNNTSQIERDLNGVKSSFQSVVSPINNISAAISRLGLAVASSLSVQQLIQYSDTWKQLSGRLSLISTDMGQLALRQEALFDIAQKTRQPLEGIISFYSRLSQFIPEVERAQYDLLGVTENVASALAITGETGASSTAALIQFTQAIGTNFEAAGQELRSLQEQAPRLTQALQRALGDGTKSLQQLKEEGLLSRESVLNALSGIGVEGQKLREELEKIPLSVRQAFARLDNAFLKYIGLSENANSATSSLALGINALANNLDVLAGGVQIVAGIFAARFIQSLAGSAIAMAAASREALRLQLTLAGMDGISQGAAKRMLLLGTASTIASRALSLIGGPVGLVITGLSLLNITSQESEGKFTDLAQKANVMAESLNNVGKSTKDLAEATRTQLVTALAQMDVELGKIKERMADPRTLRFGDRKETEPLLKERENLAKALSKIDEAINRPASTPKPKASGGEDPNLDPEKTLKDVNSLYEKNLTLITGITQESINYSNTLAELNKIKEAGLITDQQMIDAVSRLDKEYEKNTETVGLWGINIEEFGKRAASNIQDTFADFLFDPFKGGLKEMTKNFVDSVRRMIAEAQAAQLAKELFGTSAGGTGSGIFGNILGNFLGNGSTDAAAAAVSQSIAANPTFFADGGYLGPGQWGVAGEAGAELLYGGKTGVSVFNQDQIKGKGNTYIVDARGADNSAIARLEKSLMALAGPGVIEQRVNSGQVRGAI